MRFALLSLFLVGCASPIEADLVGGPAAGPEPAQPLDDPSQFLSPVPAWRGWRYEGPAGLRGAFVEAVAWWGTRGRDLGAEGGVEIHVVDLSDRPGPYGEWARVHYRGDEGADVQLFEGALRASEVELRALARHELGHVIGLQHSRDSRCLMWEGGIGGGELCPHEIGLLGR